MEVFLKEEVKVVRVCFCSSNPLEYSSLRIKYMWDLNCSFPRTIIDLVYHILQRFRIPVWPAVYHWPTLYPVSNINTIASVYVNKICLWLNKIVSHKIKQQKILPEEKSMWFSTIWWQTTFSIPRIIWLGRWVEQLKSFKNNFGDKKFAGVLLFLIIFKLIYFPFPDACLFFNSYFNVTVSLN